MSIRPGRIVRPLVWMMFAPAGTGICPRRPTAEMRSPRTTTTASSIGAPPLPSISVPPWRTSTDSCAATAAALSDGEQHREDPQLHDFLL